MKGQRWGLKCHAAYESARKRALLDELLRLREIVGERQGKE